MKKKRLFSLAVLGLAFAAVGLLSGCSGQKTLVVGIDDRSIPLTFKDEDGNLSGFDIDLARELGKRTGMEVIFKTVDLADSAQLLLTGKVDAVMGGVTATKELQQNILFTKPYLSQGVKIVANSGGSITDMAKLQGKTLGAVKSSKLLAAVDSDTSLLSLIKGGKPQLYNDCYTAFMDLDSVKIDAIALDEAAARYFVTQKETQYRLIDANIGDRQQYAVGVRRNNSLLRNQLQSALSSIVKDGTGSVISKKWFGVNLMLP